MASTQTVLGTVRGGPGTKGQALSYNGSIWLPATSYPGGSPGFAQRDWTDGQTISISVPSDPIVPRPGSMTSQFRPCINATSYPGVDPTGNTDSYAGLVQACADAAAQKLPLFLPVGNYVTSRHINLQLPITITGEIASNGNSSAGQQPSIDPIVYSPVPGEGPAPWWGGTFMGPCFTVMAGGPASSSIVGYTHTNNIYKAQVGGINGGSNFPIMFLTETGQSNLNGLSAFTFEWSINYRSALAATAIPFCGGCKTDHSPFTSAFQVTPGGVGPYTLAVSITTDHAGGTTFTTPPSAAVIALNTDYCLAVTYDGTTLKLFYGAPGASATLLTSVAATGNIVQRYWEDFIMGASSSPGGSTWPQRWGNVTAGLEWGNVRLSSTAHTITTMPATEFVATDRLSDTRLLISFDPQYRDSFSGIVATCFNPGDSGYPVAGPGSILMLWRNIISDQPGGGGGPAADFKSIILGGVDGIQVENSQFVNTYDCTFSTRKGITRVNNSYYCKDVNPIFFPSLYNTGNACHNYGAAFISTGLSQIVNPNFTSGGNSTVAIVMNALGGSEIRDLQINTLNGQVGLHINGGVGVVNDIQLVNCLLGTEDALTNLDTFVVMNNLNNVNWDGGGVHANVTAASGYNIFIDGGTQYRFNFDPAAATGCITSQFGCPSGHAPAAPIIIESAYQGQGLEAPFPWSDGTANVFVDPLERGGRTTWNATGAGAITCQWCAFSPATGPDFSCRTIIITDTGAHLTGATTVNVPTNLAGYVRRLVNKTAQPLVFGGITVAAGKSAWLESNGTATWDRTTADV